ncbi:ATP-NAD kinase [Candidatus Thorarchaeota archaeon]|nr:MAG: ATP-NAD kinase [Candidatus Thorarchaeota archaeon]
MTLLHIGFLVNPIAGMGGRVGLKGTDGVVERARELGAEPVSPDRAEDFLDALSPLFEDDKHDVSLTVCPGEMGAKECENENLPFETVHLDISDETTADDTKRCVLALADAGVDIIAFVGGDGTARDILDAIKDHGLEDILVIGIPAGVKMYSAIFVLNPRDAAEVIRLVEEGKTGETEFEIMDIDEEAFRNDELEIRLYGYMKGPSVPARFQGAKQASPATVDEKEAQEAIARYILENMDENETYILGPGTTVKSVADLLEIKKTTLGVDLYKDGEVHNDLNEDQILDLVDDFSKTKIIVSPIGHQGMLFGRGNQQISPKIIKKVERDDIIVMSTPSKLKGIEGGTLKVDTGDNSVDEMLRGYIRVLTDYKEIRLVKIE